MKVGKDKILCPLKGKERSFSYKDVVYDPEGWADASRFFPIDFDLVTLKTDTNHEFSGWVMGNDWDGHRLRDGYDVIAWKRQVED